MRESSRILAVDPGDKRLGIAVSDPTGTIASPVCVLEHVSRTEDARAILAVAKENEAGLIVIGQAVDWDGEVSYQGRKSARLAEEISTLASIPIILWNEYGSTAKAREARRLMNVRRKERAGHLDELAAAIILQTYLDAQSTITGQEDS
jgi:putative Holliday junction resolvase